MHKEDGRSCQSYLPATYGSHRAIFHHELALKLHTKYQIFKIYPISTENGMLRDIHSIWIVSKHNLSAEGRWGKLLTVSASHLWSSPFNFPPWFGSQIAHKIPDFQYPLSTDNGMLHYKERHPLVMKYSKTSFRFVQYMAWAFLCIFLSLMGPMKTFPTKVDPQNAHKMPNCKYPLSTENEILFHNERHPLLMKCFEIFLICMRQLGGAYLCILLPLMCLT